jgi:6-phosphofructo-2-kinase/fructose-2,6-biphosphatase 4
VPAVEIARGDLVEITPASYGVVSRAFHFWSGEGRGDSTGQNLYENFAEATIGKRGSMQADGGASTVNFAADAMNMEREARDEEALEKHRKRDALKARIKARKQGLLKTGGTTSAPPEKVLEGNEEEHASDDIGDLDVEELEKALEKHDIAVGDDDGVDAGRLRDERASKL